MSGGDPAPARLSRGEAAAGPPRTARWLALAVLSMPVLYLSLYLVARASHLVVHRVSISGPMHQIVPGEDCAARRLLCGRSSPCPASTEALPRIFAPLLWIEVVGRNVLAYL